MAPTADVIAEWTVRDLVERMRRPRYRCGGGVAASVALAQAAALADLVRRTARRTLDAALDEELTQALPEIVQRALAQADADRAALDQLLSALRDQTTHPDPVIVQTATAVPLATADLGFELLALLSRLAPHVPAFAYADLTAAQALSRAAILAALAMARANLPLLPSAQAEEIAVAIETRLAQLPTSTL